MTSIFLSHLDDSHYSLAIKECEMAILHATIIPAIYLVPAIAGTVNQLAPPQATTINEPPPHNRRRNDDRIRHLADYCEDEDTLPKHWDYFAQYIEAPWVQTFRHGGGCSPSGRGGGNRSRGQRDRQQGRGRSNPNSKSFKGKCN